MSSKMLNSRFESGRSLGDVVIRAIGQGAPAVIAGAIIEKA